MRKQMTKRISAVIVALVVVLGCVNIHVYLYDEAKAKEAAEQIVRDIRSTEPTAAPEAAPDAEGKTEEDADTGAFLFFSSSVAYAQANIDITVENPQIRTLKEQLKKLDKDMTPYFVAGQIGESTRGHVITRVDEKTLDAKVRADLRKLLKSVNDLRDKIYNEIIRTMKVDATAENVETTQKLFAEQWRKYAHKGWWYQDPKTEEWKQQKEEPKVPTPAEK